LPNNSNAAIQAGIFVCGRTISANDKDATKIASSLVADICDPIRKPAGIATLAGRWQSGKNQL